MKLKCKVTAVEGDGDKLTIDADVIDTASFMWRNKLTLQVADYDRNRKAFYVGRPIKVTVEAE